ncbi:MAG: DJ-1/PfpI family protein [Microcoleaceae cyanobacterium]
MTQRNVAILIFDEVEVLDFAGPFEVFSVTRTERESPFQVYTVAETLAPVLARNGLSINPKHTLSDCPAPHIVVIPGGYGSRRAMHQESILKWVKIHVHTVELMLSVCTGSLILAQAGLLEGLSATTHHHAYEELRQISSTINVIENQRFIDTGKIITSAGISAGIDMSLYVVAKLLGQAQAETTAGYMEYDWPRS